MRAFNKIASKGKLSLGLVFPLEAYSGSVAKMENQEKLAKRAEELGFKALWFRDVPFNDPSFGDAGQLYDPWVYMSHIMNPYKGYYFRYSKHYSALTTSRSYGKINQ